MINKKINLPVPILFLITVILLVIGFFAGFTYNIKYNNMNLLDSNQIPTISDIVPPTPNVNQPIPYQYVKLESNEDLPALVAVVTENALENGNKNPIVTVAKNNNIYSQGNLGEVGTAGGTAWWAAKINRKWRVIHVGQSIPECSKIAQYNLPKSFLDCYNP